MAVTRKGAPLIDAYVSHLWGSIDDVADYLEPGWREGLRHGNQAQKTLRVPPLYVNARGRAGYREWNGEINKGLDFEALRTEILESTDASRVVLGYDEEGLGAAGYTNPFLALEICRALNDWTMAEWVSRDDRLYALAMIPTNYPEGAAEEIRRIGKNERIVGLLLGPNVLGVPYGMNVYDPIYAAAVEMDLPIVLHAKADVAATLSTPQTAGGLVSTYAEYHMLAYQSVATHLISMIGQGIFDLFPSLKVLIVGSGAGWIPSVIWRTDWAYGYAYNESPWLTRLPSEYFRDHFRVTTFGLDKPRYPQQLPALLNGMRWFDRTLVYASGYPSVWGESQESVLGRLPEEWREGILNDNVLDLYRWPDRPQREKPVPTLSRSTMPGPRVVPDDLVGIARVGD
jgi:predicted TIM-barrel fold metal-dependent hydrolase